MKFGDFWCLLAMSAALAACGSSEKNKENTKTSDLPARSFFQLKANINGLNGDLVISNRGENSFAIHANGQVVLPVSWNQDASYEIKVMQEPCAQRCVVDEPDGQIQTTGTKTVNITCSSKTWEFPMASDQAISTPGTEAASPKVVMNKYGDVLLGWYQNDYFTTQLYKASFENRKWKKPDSITDHFSFSGLQSGDFSLAINDLNQSSVLWTHVNGAGRDIFIGEGDNGEWDFPTFIGQNHNVGGVQVTEHNPVIRSNALGEKIAVWSQNVGGADRLYKAEYRNGAWNFPMNLTDNINPDGTDVTWVDVAINDMGEIIIAWQQSDGTYESIYKSEYRNGLWTHPVSIADDLTMPGTNAHEPRVSMNNVGDAFIVWYQEDNASNVRYQIFVAEGRNGTWLVPASLADNISPNGKHSKNPTVIVNDQRVAKIASLYRVDDASSTYQVAIQEKNQGGSWSSPMMLSTSSALYSATRPQMGMDQEGNVVVAWSLQSVGDVYKAEYRNGVWGFANYASPINFSPGGVESPSVAVNNCRSAVVWKQNNASGIPQIYIAQYR